MTNRSSLAFLFRIALAVALMVIGAGAGQLTVVDQTINLNGVSYDGTYFRLCKSLLLSGANLDGNSSDAVEIVITGQQGGSWITGADAKDRFLPPADAYFNPTDDCSPFFNTGLGICRFKIRLVVDPSVCSNEVDVLCYSFGQIVPPQARADDFALSSAEASYTGDVLGNDEIGNTVQNGVVLSVDSFSPTTATVTLEFSFILNRNVIRVQLPPGTGSSGTVVVVYSFRTDCISSNPATATFVIRDPPIPGPDEFTFRVGEPIVIPIATLLLNDAGNGSALDAHSIIITGMQGGNTALLPDRMLPESVQFGPSMQGCYDASFDYSIGNVFGNQSPTSGVVTIHLTNPDPDCNKNCLVDALEPDDDNDGIPNDCETILGPCDLRRSTPGSLLLFPLFDNRAGNITLATVTNTNTSFATGPGNLPSGTVDLEFVYIGRYGIGGVDLPCLETNRTHRLTPGDTLTTFTSADNPNAERGFFYAFAKSPQTGSAISWNHLVGELLLFSAQDEIGESVQALSFRSSVRERGLTDLDGDGVRDLDSLEYDGAPAEILIPRFLGQDPAGAGQGNSDRLVLIALSGGAQFETIVSLTSFNDNEQPFSSSFQFRCWDAPLLAEISGAFLNEFLSNSTDNAQGEFIGAPPREYGWLKVDGASAFSTQDQVLDPAVYAVLVERIGSHVVISPPYESCSQLNGDLFGTGIFAED